MDRRRFLQNLTMLSSAACAPTFLVRTLKAAKTQGLLAQQSDDRILIVCELAGGVDGLNTVVPYTNDIYYQERPRLSIPSGQVLQLDDTLGFHPAMVGLKDLYDSGRMTIVQGVGYPNPNRSHFRSRDIWHTAEPGSVATDGWLANYFDSVGTSGSLLGMNVGGGVPKAMISSEGSSPSIQSIETYKLETDPFHPEDSSNKNAAFQQILAQPQNKYDLQQYVTQTALDATLTSIELLEGQNRYTEIGGGLVEYPAGAFAQNLKTIAQIIAADLGVRVFYVTIGGFDTHAEQSDPDANTTGTHADLLEAVSSGLKILYDDLTNMGVSEQTLIMTFSEFGRRLSENASVGTDHGTANQMFLIGDSVKPGFFGEHPSLAPQDLDPIGDMVFTRDFRDVYATALESWLGTDSSAVLGSQFEILDLIDV